MQGGLNYLVKIPARKLAIFASERSYGQYSILEKLIKSNKKFSTKLFLPAWSAEPNISN